MRKIATAVLAVSLLFSNLFSISLAQGTDGTLDTTFGENGIVGGLLNGRHISVRDSILDPNEKLIVVGRQSGPGPNYPAYPIISRFNSDGSIDSSFGDNGIVTATVFTYNGFISLDLSYEQDTYKIFTLNDYPTQYYLQKYKLDGTLDTDFGNDGTVVGGEITTAKKIKIQNDNKILIVGMQNIPESTSTPTVIRLNSDGSIDSTFNSTGQNTISIPGYWSSIVSDIKLTAGNGILISGYTTSVTTTIRSPYIIKLKNNGILDSSFGTNGILVDTQIAPSNHTNSEEIIVQPDGKILMGGTIYYTNVGNKYFLSRYTTNGARDNSFNTDGKVVGGFNDLEIMDMNSINELIDGSIIISGDGTIGNDANSFIVKFLNNGTIDNLFGNLGVVFTPTNSDYANIAKILTQDDSKIILAGDLSNGNSNDIYLARYNNSFLPEIDIIGGNLGIPIPLSIPDGANNPNNNDGTKFASMNVCSGSNQKIKHTFRIKNKGNGNLNLLDTPYINISGANPSDFSVYLQPTSPIGKNNYSNFQIEFDPTLIGVRNAIVNIHSDDRDEGSYDFAIQGVGKEQKMSVFEDNMTNETPIKYGQNINFGEIPVTKSQKKVFTLINSGTDVLNLTNHPAVVLNGKDGSFVITKQPTLLSLAPAQSTTFEITFTANQSGDFTDSAIILNNTCSGTHAGELQFSLSGRGV